MPPRPNSGPGKPREASQATLKLRCRSSARLPSASSSGLLSFQLFDETTSSSSSSSSSTASTASSPSSYSRPPAPIIFSCSDFPVSSTKHAPCAILQHAPCAILRRRGFTLPHVPCPPPPPLTARVAVLQAIHGVADRGQGSSQEDRQTLPLLSLPLLPSHSLVSPRLSLTPLSLFRALPSPPNPTPQMRP